MRLCHVPVLAVLAGCLAEPAVELLRPPRGVLQTTIAREATVTEVYAHGRDVPLEVLPIARWLLLPMTGEADIHIDLTLPTADLRRARGVIELACRHCALGDNEARLAFPMLGEDHPISFGQVMFSNLDVRFEIERGGITIDHWTIESPDVSVELTGAIVLAERWADSRLDGCLRFQPTDALRSRDPRLYDMIQLTGAARDQNGSDYIRITGTVAEPKLLPQLCR